MVIDKIEITINNGRRSAHINQRLSGRVCKKKIITVDVRQPLTTGGLHTGIYGTVHIARWVVYHSAARALSYFRSTVRRSAIYNDMFGASFDKRPQRFKRRADGSF